MSHKALAQIVQLHRDLLEISVALNTAAQGRSIEVSQHKNLAAQSQQEDLRALHFQPNDGGNCL